MKLSHKILTSTNLWLDYTNPTKEQITLVDISNGLSKISRWQSQTDYFYSVAEHCVTGANLMRILKATPEEILRFVPHDAHEAYTGDIGSPLKRMPGIYRAIKKIQHDLDVVIYEKFDLEYKECEIVKHVDLALLNWEWCVLRNMPLYELPECEEIKRVPVKIRSAALKYLTPAFWTHKVARNEYSTCLINCYNQYRRWINTNSRTYLNPFN